MICAVRGEEGASAIRATLNKLRDTARLSADEQHIEGCFGIGLGAADGRPVKLIRDAAGRVVAALEGSLRSVNGSLDVGDHTHWRGDFSLVRIGPDGLLLARGRMGGRSLYFSDANRTRTWVVCSRMAPLLASLDVRPSIKVQRLTHYFDGSVDPSLTPYEHVRRLRSGAVLWVRPDGSSWEGTLPQLLPAAGIDPRGTVDDFAHAIFERLDHAVARAVGTRRVAVSVGGLDSSGVLAVTIARARGASPRDVHAIALDFEGAGSDRPYLQSLCDAYALTPIRVKPRACGQYVRDAMVMDAMPQPAPLVGCDRGILSAAQRLGAETLLTGIGGDELFEGDPAIFADLIVRHEWIAGVRGALRLTLPYAMPFVRRVQHLLVLPLLRRKFPVAMAALHAYRRAQSLRRRYSWAGPVLVEHYETMRREVDTVSDELDSAKFINAFNQSAHALNVSDLHGQLEQLVSGCQYAHPLLDEDLAELVMAIPPAHLMFGDQGRGLLRLALRDVLPADLRTRSDKASFESAIGEMVEGAGGLASFGDLANMRHLGNAGLVEPKRFRQFFEQTLKLPTEQIRYLDFWPALALERFLAGT